MCWYKDIGSKVVMDDFEQKWSPIVAEDGQIAKKRATLHEGSYKYWRFIFDGWLISSPIGIHELPKAGIAMGLGLTYSSRAHKDI